LEVEQFEFYRGESQVGAVGDNCLRKEMAKAVLGLSRINETQKNLDEFIYRLTRYFRINR
jgi:hypothetical protein